MKREKVIQKVAECIHLIPCPHPIRVAIDGVDASGKTTFANELGLILEHTQRQIIRASVDSFHLPKQERYSKGKFSPVGFYNCSYNYQALIENLLKPLGPSGDRHFKTAVFDLLNDRPISPPTETAQPNAILLLDGIFLLRQELIPFWDFTIYLHTDFDQSFSRGVARDASLLGSEEQAARHYRMRYIPGQKLYQAEIHPRDKADILIDNSDVKTPRILKIFNKLIQSN